MNVGEQNSPSSSLQSVEVVMEWMCGQEEHSALGVALQCQYAKLKGLLSLTWL